MPKAIKARRPESKQWVGQTFTLQWGELEAAAEEIEKEQPEK